ncbi:sigma-70 family RNA polymerase sigma factor [bacterium]|nr:sigma-70 family RNA polymerase sigma factor [bacterium]
MTREPHHHDSSLNLGQANDRKLIDQTLSGHNEAFDVLVTRYRDRIYSLAYHMLSNAEEAQDIAQEVFVRAYKNLSKFRHESSFYTWLYRIAVNIVYTQAKKASRRRELYDQAFKDLRMKPGKMPETPEGLAQLEELKEMILRAIRQLDPRFRQVLILKEIEGHDVSEVAKMLKLPQGTVKSRLYRAREDLRHIIQSWKAYSSEGTTE